jgi:hypothetical protein
MSNENILPVYSIDARLHNKGHTDYWKNRFEDRWIDMSKCKKFAVSHLRALFVTTSGHFIAANECPEEHYEFACHLTDGEAAAMVKEANNPELTELWKESSINDSLDVYRL